MLLCAGWTAIHYMHGCFFFFFFQAEDGIRDLTVTGVQTCALPISNGTTSVAPIRGCSPVCRERSMRSVATRMAANAASTLASGGATNVNTERLWAASAWTSSSLTPGTPVSAVRSASMVAAFLPSEKLGTHSTRGDGIDTSNAECGIRNAELMDARRAPGSRLHSAYRTPHPPPTCYSHEI